MLVTESTNFAMSSFQSSIDTVSNQVAIFLRVALYSVRTSDLGDRFLELVIAVLGGYIPCHY